MNVFTHDFVYRLADGSYRLEEFSDPTDWSVFLSVMTVEAFKKRHKLGVIA